MTTEVRVTTEPKQGAVAGQNTGEVKTLTVEKSKEEKKFSPTVTGNQNMCGGCPRDYNI